MKQEESMGRREVTVDKNVYDSCILIDNIIVLQNKIKNWQDLDIPPFDSINKH